MKSLDTGMQCCLQIDYQEQRALGYRQLPICTPGYLLSSSINKNFNQKKQSVLNSKTVTEKFLLEALFNQISEWCLGKRSWREAGKQSYNLRSELTDTSLNFFFHSFFLFFYFISYLSFLLPSPPSFLSFLCFQFCNQLPSLCFAGINVICLSP